MDDLELTISRLLGQVRSGQDAALELEPPAEQPVLNGLAAALAGLCRVVRVTAPAAGLGMSGFMAQVAGDADVTAQDDAVLELGYRVLAMPDQPGAQIALLLSGADRLQRPVLRFIQHVARGAGSLVLVMAGPPGWVAALDPADYSTLRSRLGAPAATRPAVVPVAEPVKPVVIFPSPAVVPAARPAVRASVPPRFLGAPGWTLAGLGMAASVAFGMWLGGQRSPTSTPASEAPTASREVAAVNSAPERTPAPAPAPTPATTATKLAAAPLPATDPPRTQPAPTAPSVAAAITASVPPNAPVAAAPTATPTAAPAPQAEPVATPGPAETAPADHVRTAEAAAAHRRPARHLEARIHDEPAPRRATTRLVARQQGYGSGEPEDGPAWERPGFSPYANGLYNQGPYIGTFMADRYGVRRFRFGQDSGD